MLGRVAIKIPNLIVLSQHCQVPKHCNMNAIIAKLGMLNTALVGEAESLRAVLDMSLVGMSEGSIFSYGGAL